MTTDNHDPFAFAGRRDDADAGVLALFHDWLDASRAADQLDDETEREELLDRRDEVEKEIMSTLGGGAVALAIKTYFFVRVESCTSWTPERATLRCPELLGRGAGEVVANILRDAAKQVPEIAELAAPIIHEDALLIDADIEIQWCRRRVWPDESKRDADVSKKLAKALDRVARVEAKTPRGEEIKLRHAPIDEAELRARAEALAAEYDAPLPEGDAGLIEAERRWLNYDDKRRHLFGEITGEFEEEVLEPTVYRAHGALRKFIEETPPVGLDGVRVKLRLLSLIDHDPDAVQSAAAQILATVEREARP